MHFGTLYYTTHKHFKSINAHLSHAIKFLVIDYSKNMFIVLKKQNKYTTLTKAYFIKKSIYVHLFLNMRITT
jgi:hypothetical protein